MIGRMPKDQGRRALQWRPNWTKARILPNFRRHVHGEVWLALQTMLRSDGRELCKPRHARGYEVDGEINTADDALLLEIKTDVSAAKVYAGVGQLALPPPATSFERIREDTAAAGPSSPTTRRGAGKLRRRAAQLQSCDKGREDRGTILNGLPRKMRLKIAG